MSGFEKLNNFWEELKKRNVVRALIFYAVTGWLIIQFAATTFPYLNLPDWAVTVVIIALLIGLPIVLIVSWIYELTTEGLKKTDSIDRERSVSVKTGKRINRLTIIILSLAVVFLLVDKFYLSAPTQSEVERTESIAIFPFAIQGGEGIQYLREGMVDLISTKLDGIPGMNAIDPNVLLTKLEGRNINVRDPESAAGVARELGANRVILGSVTQAGAELQVKISKYDNNGGPIGETIVEHGSVTVLYGKVDNVIRRLIAEELEEKGSDIESLAVLATNSIESIIPFLQGEQLRRKGQYRDALAQFKESISQDSTFAMSYIRYLETAGWLDEVRVENRETQFTPYIKRLAVLKDGLKGKLYDLADAKSTFYLGNGDAEEKFWKLLNRYGESRDILHGLAESIYHYRVLANEDAFEAKVYFERLLEIDPSNVEYLNHLADIAADEDNAEELSALIDRGNADWEYRPFAEYQSLLLKDTITDEELAAYTNLKLGSSLLTLRNPIRMPENLATVERILNLSKHPFKRPFIRFAEYGKKLVYGEHSALIGSLLEKEKDASGNYQVRNSWLLLWLLQLGHGDLHVIDDHTDEFLMYIEAGKKSNLNGLPPIMLDYCSGIMHLINDDLELLDPILASFKARFEDSTETPFGPMSGLTKIGYYNLQGMKAFRNGEFDESMAYLDSAVSQGTEVSIAFSPGAMKSRHLYQAENLVRQEEYASALVRYQRMLRTDVSSLTGGVTWGYLMYRIAGMHDLLGQEEQAKAYYQKFATVYANADEVYQPWVDDAYQRLSILVGRPEQELRGNIDQLEN